jgi:YHS domain-containing protein
MLRVALFLLFCFLLGRAIWRFLSGVVDGAMRPNRPAARTPARGVQMARDPVCGTFVVPSRALAIDEGSQRTYFCSERCRDRYRERSA